MCSSINDNISIILVQLAAAYVKKSPVELDEKRLVAVRYARLFGQLLPWVEAFVRSPAEDSSKATLTENLKTLLPVNSVGKCMEILQDLKCEIHSDNAHRCKYLDSLSRLQWRVDITISSSVLSRVLEPNIIMQLELNSGRKVTFELSVAKFHKLRFTVASILEEMDRVNTKLSAIKA